MSRNRLVTIVLSFVFVVTLFFIGSRVVHYILNKNQDDLFSKPMNLDVTTEDDKIMQGLWYEENGDLANSYKVFSQLYKDTKAEAYQIKKIHL